MNILIVEDDYFQAEWIEQIVLKEFSGSRTKILRTETEFRDFMREGGFKPDVIILDVILPWTVPGSKAEPPPEEVRNNGRHRAGVRCWRHLAENPETRDIPVVLYTVLDTEDLQEDIPPNVRYLSKQSDPVPLVEEIKRLTQRP